MRSIAVVGLALAALLGVATTQPAAAWDDSHNRGFYGADVYVHHHVYAPPRRVRHVYNISRPGPYHVHVVQYAGTPYVFHDARASYYSPRYWHWRAPYRHW